MVLIAYSDYQCPFCGRWVEETMPELIDRYVDSGVLRIEWREFPYLGEASWQLAVGARAAAEQDLFWEFHERVYQELDKFDGAGRTCVHTWWTSLLRWGRTGNSSLLTWTVTILLSPCRPTSLKVNL